LPSQVQLAARVQARARATEDDSPAARLRLAIELGQELSAAGDVLVERFVSEARAAGLSWTQIGHEFGTSKQAAQKRYGARAADEAWSGRWAPAAHQALTGAWEEARELGYDYVGTEHLLLALLAVEEGVAAEVLLDLGVTREGILATSCMAGAAPGSPPREPLAIMPRMKQSLALARRIGARLEQRVPDTEHLLAAILDVPGAMAVEILRRLGVKPGEVRRDLAARLDVDPERLATGRRRRRRLLARAS
jgi:ATP-dependent Clp protease ATP-binding subunit ClpA